MEAATPRRRPPPILEGINLTQIFLRGPRPGNAAMRGRLLATSMITGVALFSAWAANAQAPAAPADSNSVAEVVVTGTMFRTNVQTQANPVTVLTPQQITVQGITTVADAVRSISADNSGTLPPAFPGAFAFGATGVALRGLTVNSTLVLTDGIRNANYPIGDDGVRDFVDLNTLQLSAVDHIDVLKDGASSLYGADAIGGVVNIVMKPHFTGVEGTVEGGWTERGGGANQHVDLTVGKGDLDTDKYNVYVSVEYEHTDPIEVSQRPFPFNSTDLTSIGGENPGNGQLPPSGTFFGSNYPAFAPASATSILNGTQTGPWTVPGGCGKLGTLTTVPGAFGNDQYCAQNLSSYLYDFPRQTKGGVYARYSVQFDPNTVGYVSFNYYQNAIYQPEAESQVLNSVPFNTEALALPPTLANGQPNPNDPYVNAACLKSSSCPYALVSSAFPLTEFEEVTDHRYRGVADLKGLAAGWDYEVDLEAEHQELDYEQGGFPSYSAEIAAVNNGTYNFLNPSANSSAELYTVVPNESKVATSNMDSIDVHGTHSLIALPGGDMKLGLGAHMHYEDQNNPELNPNGNLEGLGVDHAEGHRMVTSAFFELDSPLIQSLDLDLSGRFDHYSDFGNDFSPKAGLKWQPIRQFTLRGTWSEGYRAPSFAEIGTSAVGGFVNYTPVNDTSATPAFLAGHSPGGTPDAYISNQYALEEVSVANPHIKPERSQSFTFGSVVQPVSNISLSGDFYYVQKDDLIAPGSQGPALANYYAGLPQATGTYVIADTPDPNAPGALPRPVVIGTAYTNGNSLITTGVDVEFRARFGLPYDVGMTTVLDATDIFEYRYSQPGVPTYDFVGTESPYNLSSGAGTPKYKVNWVTTFTRGALSVAATYNYTSGMFENAADLGVPGCISNLAGNCKMNGFGYVDLNADYKVNKQIDLFLHVANITNALPPVDQINYGGINYNPTYDESGIIGRAFKVGVHFRY